MEAIHFATSNSKIFFWILTHGLNENTDYNDKVKHVNMNVFFYPPSLSAEWEESEKLGRQVISDWTCPHVPCLFAVVICHAISFYGAEYPFMSAFKIERDEESIPCIHYVRYDHIVTYYCVYYAEYVHCVD